MEFLKVAIKICVNRLSQVQSPTQRAVLTVSSSLALCIRWVGREREREKERESRETISVRLGEAGMAELPGGTIPVSNS